MKRDHQNYEVNFTGEVKTDCKEITKYSPEEVRTTEDTVTTAINIIKYGFVY